MLQSTSKKHLREIVQLQGEIKIEGLSKIVLTYNRNQFTKKTYTTMPMPSKEENQRIVPNVTN